MPSKYKRKSRIREPFRKIVIAMEGNDTEPKYFRALRSKKHSAQLELKILERKKNDTRSAPRHVFSQILEYTKTIDYDKDDECWIVIDKDNWPEKQLREVAAGCKNCGYGMAISNPCFEIWLICHYGIPGKADTSKTVKKRWRKIRSEKGSPAFPDILENIDTAIKNARKLDTEPSTRWPNNQATRVYLLIEEINRTIP
ncbi:MAG: RloB family protein [Fibrobacterota bacterium]